MNFQDLKKVEKADFYLDLAFSRAKEKALSLTVRKQDRLTKAVMKEKVRLDVINNVLSEQLLRIIKSFPNFDELDRFYQELIRVSVEYVLLRKSLGAVSWAIKQTATLRKKYSVKVGNAKNLSQVSQLRREYYGRFSSVLKQIKPNLAYLEECRHTLKKLPAVKTKMYTVCLFGFPNVGKSTLLRALTTAEPEVNTYPFTTKSLNLGYIKTPAVKIQVIDTPGTLDRFDKMNDIERQAYLALKHLADVVVFVIDPTMELQQQYKLLEKAKNTRKPVIVYVSKTDIAKAPAIEDSVTDPEILQRELIKLGHANP